MRLRYTLFMNVSRKKITETLRKVYLFHNLEKEYIDLLLDNAEVVFFPTDKMVYLEGTPASYFYIIYQGELEILKERNHALIQLNNLREFYSFGEDALTNNRTRQSSARAITDLILIKFSESILSKLGKESTVFQKNLNIILTTYNHLIHKSVIPGKDEAVCYIGQPHPIIVVLKMIFALLAVFGLSILLIQSINSGFFAYNILFWGMGALAITVLVWMGWQFLEWSNDLFFFTDKRIINRQRSLFSYETKHETPISAIESVQVKRSYFGRGFNFGDLEIKTFTGSMRLAFVPDISSAQQILSFLTERRKERWEEEEKQTFERDIRERINPEILREGDNLISYPEKSSTQIQSLGSIPGRITDNNTPNIIYRTHWTILFAKIFIPVFLLMSHLFFYLFLAANNAKIINGITFNIIMLINCIVLISLVAYRFFDWRNDLYIITEDYLIDIDRRPFGMEEKRSAPIKNIQSIRYKRNGIFGLLFNFGTVYTRIGDEEFTFDNVFQPADVQEALFAAKERFHQNQIDVEKGAQRRKAVDWIDSYHQIIKEQRNDDLNNSSGDVE